MNGGSEKREDDVDAVNNELHYSVEGKYWTALSELRSLEDATTKLFLSFPHRIFCNDYICRERISPIISVRVTAEHL